MPEPPARTPTTTASEEVSRAEDRHDKPTPVTLIPANITLELRAEARRYRLFPELTADARQLRWRARIVGRPKEATRARKEAGDAAAAAAEIGARGALSPADDPALMLPLVLLRHPSDAKARRGEGKREAFFFLLLHEQQQADSCPEFPQSGRIILFGKQ